MRILITEYKRMFYEKKIIYLTIITITYVTICCLLHWLRFKLDYDYVEVNYEMSGFYLWQMNIDESFMTALMKIIPPMIFVFSFMDDRKYGIDNQICMKTRSNIYFVIKYIVIISGGMLYNFFVVALVYIPVYCFLSTGDTQFNYLDRSNALVGNLFNGDTAFEFIIIIAIYYALVGGICAGMSYVISCWIDNRVLVCLIPYILFEILRKVLNQKYILANIIIGDVDSGMCDKPIIYYICYFVWWILLISIIFVISYTINIENER